MIFYSAFCILHSALPFAQSPVTQLTSNNIFSLSGASDTLWLATERGVNFRTSVHTQESWNGFEMADGVIDMAYGGGGAAAFVYRDDYASPMGFWYFDHNSGGTPKPLLSFGFSRDLRETDSAYLAGGIAYKNGYFYSPFNWGGIVRYDPVSNSVRAIMPGESDDKWTAPSSLAFNSEDPIGRDSLKVLSITDFDDDKLLITTPRMLLTYNTALKTWDTLHTGGAVQLAGEGFVSFNATVVTRRNDGESIYSLMTVKNGNETYTSLYVFSANGTGWTKALDNRRIAGLYPVAGSGLFVFFKDGDRYRAGLYQDTIIAPSASVTLREIMPHDSLRAKLAAAERGAGDPNIQDILFMPSANTPAVGTLAIATASGLYLCAVAEPLAGVYDEFKFINYVRSVKKGEAYALPGVMRTSIDGRYDKSVFVYRLKKDGKVTISVYDYNMSLVKTVVKGKRRTAGERSTDPAQDVWDGTNHAGRSVSPGVYYFKITSSSGDRFFGKVIVAK